MDLSQRFNFDWWSYNPYFSPPSTTSAMSMWVAKQVVKDGTSSAAKSLGLEDDKKAKSQKLTREEIKKLEAEREEERERRRSKNRNRHDALRKKHGVKTSAEHAQGVWTGE